MAAAPLLVGAVVFAIVFRLLVTVAAERPDEAVTFALSTPVVTAWCVAVAGQMAIWVVLAPAILARFARYRQEASGRRWEIVAVLVALVLLFALLKSGDKLVSNLTFVAAQKMKVGIITAFGFSIAVPCLLGMRFASVRASEVAATASGSVVDLNTLRSAREDLDWFLLVSGVIVAGATLSTGLARNAFNTLIRPEAVSAVNVILYGSFCSAIIAAAYIPAYSLIAESARRIMTIAVPDGEGGADEWIKAEEKRAKLAALLGVNATALDRLTGGLGILSPLAASALSLIKL